MVHPTTGDLLLVIFTIAATTGILILIDTRVSVRRHRTKVDGTHVIFCFFLLSAGLVLRGLFDIGLLKKEIGQQEVKLNMYQ
jgi:hypothetical protein